MKVSILFKERRGLYLYLLRECGRGGVKGGAQLAAVSRYKTDEYWLTEHTSQRKIELIVIIPLLV